MDRVMKAMEKEKGNERGGGRSTTYGGMIDRVMKALVKEGEMKG